MAPRAKARAHAAAPATPPKVPQKVAIPPGSAFGSHFTLIGDGKGGQTLMCTRLRFWECNGCHFEKNPKPALFCGKCGQGKSDTAWETGGAKPPAARAPWRREPAVQAASVQDPAIKDIADEIRKKEKAIASMQGMCDEPGMAAVLETNTKMLDTLRRRQASLLPASDQVSKVEEDVKRAKLVLEGKSQDEIVARAKLVAAQADLDSAVIAKNGAQRELHAAEHRRAEVLVRLAPCPPPPLPAATIISWTNLASNVKAFKEHKARFGADEEFENALTVLQNKAEAAFAAEQQAQQDAAAQAAAAAAAAAVALAAAQPATGGLPPTQEYDRSTGAPSVGGSSGSGSEGGGTAMDWTAFSTSFGAELGLSIEPELLVAAAKRAADGLAGPPGPRQRLTGPGDAVVEGNSP